MPPFQSIFRQVVGSGRIASVKNSVYTDLADPLRDQLGFVFPQARYRYSTGIEVNIFHQRIFSLDCVHEHRQGLVDCRVIVTAAACQMRDLYCHIRSLRQNLLQENTGFLCSVWPMVVNVRVQMYRDCHPALISGAEHLQHFSYMFRIVEIDIRVAKVQLEASPQVRVFRAACNLIERIRPQRIYTAKRKQPISTIAR